MQKQLALESKYASWIQNNLDTEHIFSGLLWLIADWCSPCSSCYARSIVRGKVREINDIPGSCCKGKIDISSRSKQMIKIPNPTQRSWPLYFQIVALHFGAVHVQPAKKQLNLDPWRLLIAPSMAKFNQSPISLYNSFINDQQC